MITRPDPLLSGKLTEPVEALAQRYAAQLIARQPQELLSKRRLQGIMRQIAFRKSI